MAKATEMLWCGHCAQLCDIHTTVIFHIYAQSSEVQDWLGVATEKSLSSQYVWSALQLTFVKIYMHKYDPIYTIVLYIAVPGISKKAQRLAWRYSRGEAWLHQAETLHAL